MNAAADFKQGSTVGQQMPAWTMAASDGSMVSSSDLAGNSYVLFMYPKAHTGG